MNTGDARLARPSSVTVGGAAATDPNWVDDTRGTSDITFVDDDAGTVTPGNNDAFIDRFEGWTFRCTGQVDRLTVNIASIEAQPVDATGSPVGDTVVDLAFAVVDVLQPAIDITKTALRGVVLDPDAGVSSEMTPGSLGCGREPVVPVGAGARTR